MKTNNVRGLLALLLALVMVFALAACNDTTDPTIPGTTSGENPNPTTTGTQPAPTEGNKLSISVVPAELEIYAGEDMDLMFGVSASDADASLIIQDDEGFDSETPGTYTITYKASKDGESVTATRVVVVLPPRSNVAMEVRANRLGEDKWVGNVVRFAYELFVELNADSQLPNQSGIFKNTSDKPIILSVEGSYGCSAVVDANGVVIEGRDGANSKLVNAENPSRTSSSVTTLTIDGESVSVSSAFAKNLQIPAGGYAIIIQPNYAGSTADTDGRSFMNYNVIYEIGNVVRLYWVDSNEDLTSYVNQAPSVSGNSGLLALRGDGAFDLNTMILAGITAKDDNGTFTGDDDVNLETITIVDIGGFDINAEGVYTIRLSVTDGEKTTEFTRTVEVKGSGIGVISVGEQSMNVDAEHVALNQDLTSAANYSFVIYTPAYQGSINWSNGFGIAYVLDRYGYVVRIYDGTAGKYFDAANPSGVVDGTCTPQGYVNEAFDSLQEGEYLIIAPNSSANNAQGGSRWFLHKYKTVGVKMVIMNLEFEEKP